MKTITVCLFSLVALMFPLVSHAATAEEVDAWKAKFPAASRTDSPKLQQFITSYQRAVGQVKPGATKTILLLRDKLARDQASMQRVLNPPKPNPKITPAMQVEAAAANKWLNDKFAPYLAKVPE